MAIINQYGQRLTQHKLLDAAADSRYRNGRVRIQNRPLEKLITSQDRDIIVSLSKKLFFNYGVMRGVANQKASYSIGQDFDPQYLRPNENTAEDIEEVLSYLNDRLSTSIDVRGYCYDWHENLRGVSLDIDISGENFTLLTRDEDGNAAIQNIPAFAVKTKGNNINDGSEVRGGKIWEGIIYSQQGKPLFYRVSTGDQEDEFEDIPASSIIHTFDPPLGEGKRGLPSAVHAIEDIRHILQSTAYESIRQMIMSSVGLIIENEDGEDDTEQLLSGGDLAITKGVKEKAISPTIYTMEAGTGQKITQLRHESGGDLFESFHDRLIRSYVKGADWSYSLAWKHQQQGTAERAEILTVRGAIKQRQRKLKKWARRVISYIYADAIEQNLTPLLSDITAWNFTIPPRLSVDDGRESKMMMEEYKLGYRSMSDLIDGGNVKAIAERKAEEAAIFEIARREAEQKFGVPIEARKMQMLTPNEQSQQEATNELTEKTE